jgi:DNA-binding NarL/FixJ family response regulator
MSEAAPGKRLRLLLVDDHALVRAGIRSLLEKMPEVEVIAEAGDGRVALDLAREHRPDVVLMDLAMSELNGLEATARLKKDQPETHVIILSMHTNEEYVVQALRAGAAGSLVKDAAATELQAAMRTVARGERYLSPSISREAVAEYEARASDGPASHLTPRQREILQLIAEGKNTKEIAYTLGVSVKTVETHRALLMVRLKIFDVPGLVRYAMRIGLVQGERGLG